MDTVLSICCNPEQYNALLRAYMRAGVPNIAAPQDNIVLAFVYDCLRKYQIEYFLSGGNFALESILQRGNTHPANDLTNIRDINRKFGDKPLNKLRFLSLKRSIIDIKLLKLKSPRPLNYIDYNRQRAFDELKEFCGFEYYGRKHLENMFTAFLQLYWLPKKFGVDKRSSHLSSMIISGQITREEALQEYAEPICDETLMNTYIEKLKKGIGISDQEFGEIMKAPPHQHAEFACEKDTLLYHLMMMFRKARRKNG